MRGRLALTAAARPFVRLIERLPQLHVAQGGRTPVARAVPELTKLGLVDEWLAEELDLKLTVTDSLTLEHPAAALPRAEQLLRDADDWQLAALDMMTSSTKSLVISLALARGRIGASEACVAARVAEQHQIDEWGEVEMGHDLDAADCAVRLSASSTFLRLMDRPWKDSGS